MAMGLGRLVHVVSTLLHIISLVDSIQHRDAAATSVCWAVATCERASAAAVQPYRIRAVLHGRAGPVTVRLHRCEPQRCCQRDLRLWSAAGAAQAAGSRHPLGSPTPSWRPRRSLAGGVVPCMQCSRNLAALACRTQSATPAGWKCTAASESGGGALARGYCTPSNVPAPSTER